MYMAMTIDRNKTQNFLWAVWAAQNTYSTSNANLMLLEVGIPENVSEWEKFDILYREKSLNGLSSHMWGDRVIGVDYVQENQVSWTDGYIQIIPEELELGDLTQDNIIDASDAAWILLAAAKEGSGQENAVLTEAQKKAADINLDGLIDAVDAAYILQYAVQNGSGDFSGSLSDFINHF